MVTSVGRTLGASLGMAAVISLVQGHLHARVSIPVELAALVLLRGSFYGVLAFLFQGGELHAFLNALSTLWMKCRRPISKQPRVNLTGLLFRRPPMTKVLWQREAPAPERREWARWA